MFGRVAMARAVLAARRSPLDFEERLVEGEPFLFGHCRFCGERLSGISLRRYGRAKAERRLRFSAEQHLSAGCPAQASEPGSGKPDR
jgi:hypothetical protein